MSSTCERDDGRKVALKSNACPLPPNHLEEYQGSAAASSVTKGQGMAFTVHMLHVCHLHVLLTYSVCAILLTCVNALETNGTTNELVRNLEGREAGSLLCDRLFWGPTVCTSAHPT